MHFRGVKNHSVPEKKIQRYSEYLYDQVIFKSNFRSEIFSPRQSNINISYTFPAYSKNELVLNKLTYIGPERQLERLPYSSVTLDSISLQQISTSSCYIEEVG